MRPTSRIPISLPALLIALTASGCGRGWEADTHPASGRISVNGQAPAGALVQLHPVGPAPDERNSRPWGLVAEDGTFALSTYEAGDGAPAGEYAVTVTWPDDPTVPSMTDRLGFRYADPGRSSWKVTIDEGENALPTIELTDSAIAPPGPKPGRASGPEMLGVADATSRHPLP